MAKPCALAQRYGSVADAYDRVWAPPLLAFARALLDALAISDREQVVDLGAGTGAISREVGAIALDRTEQMLARASAKGLRTVLCDIRRVPVADEQFDVALSTFVLQHVPTPGVVAAEAYRILRRGGRYATATWSPDHGEAGGVYDILAETFAGLPEEAATFTTWHDRVDAPDKMRRYAKRAGFSSVRAWREEVSYEWPAENFHTWATTMGPYGRRLNALDPSSREQIARTLRSRLEAADPRDLQWNATVVYCVAEK